LPWSMCAMMQKLRMKRGSIFCGRSDGEVAAKSRKRCALGT
jgi:hypothetical protein